MIEVSGIRYGCTWTYDGRVAAMPLRIEFGTRGPEVTVDAMLEGQGHTFMQLGQLLTLVAEMYPRGEVVLAGRIPVEVLTAVMAMGYPVILQPDE